MKIISKNKQSHLPWADLGSWGRGGGGGDDGTAGPQFFLPFCNRLSSDIMHSIVFKNPLKALTLGPILPELL